LVGVVVLSIFLVLIGEILICRWNGELGKLWYVDLVDFMGERVGEQV
jgi:hypothetical protein